MDYVFSFRKFANLQTARNDYPRTYRALRAQNVIPSTSVVSSQMENSSQASSQAMSVEEDETLEALIRNDNFPRDLLLELQGLKAFVKQKRAIIEDSNRKPQMEPTGDGDVFVAVVDTTETTLQMLAEVHGHIEVVDNIITKLKALRIAVQQMNKKHASSIASDCSGFLITLQPQSHSIALSQINEINAFFSTFFLILCTSSSADQLRSLRERAVKYRMFFDELRQNREGNNSILTTHLLPTHTLTTHLNTSRCYSDRYCH